MVGIVRKATGWMIILQVCVILVCDGFTVLPAYKQLGKLTSKEDIHQPSFHHFGKYELCGSFKGQKYLYRALTENLHDLKASFVEQFVINMCKPEHHSVLDLWTAEIFDQDGDGYVSHFEKNAFDSDDLEWR